MTWKNKLPEGVPVSMASVRLLNYTPCVKYSHQIHQIFHASAKSVLFPDDQHVALAKSFLPLGQAGPFSAAAAELVFKDLLQPALAGLRFKSLRF